MHVLCLLSIASVVLVLGSASAPADDAAGRAAPADGTEPAEIPAGTAAPLRAPDPSGAPAPESAGSPAHAAPLTHATPASSPASSLPGEGTAPLTTYTADERPSATNNWMPGFGVAPLNTRPDAPDRRPLSDERAHPLPSSVAVPFGPGPTLPPPQPPDPRTLRAVRLEVLVGALWRSRATEALVQASVEFGRLQGFSGIVHGGVFVSPDREFVAVNDFPLGAGFVARRRFGSRPLYGSVGLTAGLLVHRASTDLGVIHRVDPDFQLPLRFAWTAGQVGLSVALLQGFSVRARSYSRRGVDVWERIPYRIGFAVGLHFDVGVGPAKPRRSAR